MKKVMVVMGTRPEAIKLAPIVHELRENFSQHFSCVAVCTGQHKSLLDQALEAFDLQFAYDLKVMQPNQTLFDTTTKVLLGMREPLERERPDFLIVQGDTTSTFVAALAGYYNKIPVCHVEAGVTHRPTL